ncbi:uncharacterized protein LOC116063679 [Sander lucioperca]|uniref:uncharacterized protein LOC116063679 n=1 Tax=Sander lucioperca TaxID=283035 RepID=UPI00125D0130|nr:uncharacterized protein LOC116063679 [Sander lucioperca]
MSRRLKFGLLVLLGSLWMWPNNVVAGNSENVQLICRESLDAAVGDNVTLDFHLEPGSDATQWTAFVFKCEQSSDNVLVYRSGGFSDEDQANRFRGRVSPDSSWELREGQLAWKISPFGESDAGTYKCIVRTRTRTHQLPCSTGLKIKQFHPHEESNTTVVNPSDGYQRHNTSSLIPKKPTDGNNTGSTNTLFAGAIAAIVTAVIISIIIAIIFIAGVISGGFDGRCPFLLSFSRLPCRRRFEGVRQNDPDAPVAHNGPVQAVEGRAGVQENARWVTIPLEEIGDPNPPGDVNV